MCVSPKTFKREDGQLLTVPCGHCYQCVRKRKLEWEIRISSEHSASTCSFFSLISYNEDNLPSPPVADKLAIQKLVRRLRRYLEYHHGEDVKLKYFIVSEYGEKRNRLHYHAIFFVKGIYLDRFQWKVLLETEWGKGFCSAYELSNNWIHYCVKYMQKSYNMMLASRLGFDAYFESAKKQYDKSDFGINKLMIPYSIPDGYPKYYIKGKGLSLPRSWYEKAFANSWQKSIIAKSFSLNNSKELNQIYKDYERQNSFLYKNSDCAEKEKVYYDPSKGLELSKEF